MSAIDQTVALLRSQVGETIASASLDLDASPPLGTVVRRRRKELGLTIEQFRDAMGYDRPRVWRLETNRTVSPTILTIYQLSCALQMPFTTLASAALVTALGRTDLEE